MNKLLVIASLFLFTNLSTHTSCTEKKLTETKADTAIADSSAKKILTGAEQFEKYLPLLMNKNIALVVNHTAVVGNAHLIDTLLASGVNIKKIFAPEHGFRGKADAGEKVNNETDKKTGLPIISLYGNNKKPTAQQLKDVDLVIFDIQDAGVRFYTYISTMHYTMEACAENKKELLILDRPNPNGYYVDGPVLDMKYKSFIGMHPIPLVHGLSVGELALMINGEKWLDSGKVCNLKVITNKNYSHKDTYSLPVKPSPNLPNDLAIKLYPSLGLFEGTIISVGRGTTFPFQVIGAPGKNYGSFTFTPKSLDGMAKNPPYENKVCNGRDLRSEKITDGFSVSYLIDMYTKTANKDTFFLKTNFINKLAGNDKLKEQIRSGMTEAQIKETWKADLEKYKAIRKKYLLYQDFE
ncbi:MAG: DUF1343 domain-containing protein [Cytophagaceae bacterium]|nr:DUF1343 domain-containing protein [Cytophagaceae bacterium]